MVSKRIITVNRRGVRRVFQHTAETVAKMEMEVSLLLLIDAGASVLGRGQGRCPYDRVNS